ncbi:MAG: ParA family protein, partial [Romboutsia timonensis]|nr:ParA family protein [Romboutsia timonensis]
MKILTFFNIKGGIGKTTLTLLTAYKLAKENKKILLIDADLQANLT